MPANDTVRRGYCHGYCTAQPTLLRSGYLPPEDPSCMRCTTA